MRQLSKQRPSSCECHIAGRPNQNTQNQFLPSASGDKESQPIASA